MGVAREARLDRGGKSFSLPHMANNAGILSKPAPQTLHESIEVTIVMPCLNEAETVAICVQKAIRGLREQCLRRGRGGGQRQHRRFARSRPQGARDVSVSQKGYGNALMGGIAAARGKFVLMGDADDSTTSATSVDLSKNFARAMTL